MARGSRLDALVCELERNWLRDYSYQPFPGAGGTFLQAAIAAGVAAY